MLALTADHGVADIPEQAGAGRLANEDLGAVAEQALVEHWGAPVTGRYVAASLAGQIYFADGVFERLAASSAAMDALERALLDVPGLVRVVRRDHLDRGDEVTQAIARGYRADRSGDLFLIPRRDWIIEQRADGDATTHGTMYEYRPARAADAPRHGRPIGPQPRPGNPARHRHDAGTRGRHPVVEP